MARVSVVIPNWNRADLLAAALASVARQTHAVTETIVVDNGSTDNSIDVARKAGARVVKLERNRGFCRAVNEGIRAVSSEWVLILNNDVEIGDRWLERLLAAAEARGAWFATGKLLQHGDPSRLDGAWDALCRGACAWRCGHARTDGPPWNQQRTIRFAPFTALLARAGLFQRLGPLDETFESYLEDADFGIRCATAGYSGVYVPEAMAWHKGSATLGRWNKESVRRISRNQLLLVAKHFPPGWILRLGWPVLVGQLLWGFVALRHGAVWPYIVGKVEALRMFRKVRSRTGASGPRRHIDKKLARHFGPSRPLCGEFLKNASPTANGLSAILRESENEIQELQRQTGYDWYWRLYFALT